MKLMLAIVAGVPHSVVLVCKRRLRGITVTMASRAGDDGSQNHEMSLLLS
jgi:hypothetical protein